MYTSKHLKKYVCVISIFSHFDGILIINYLSWFLSFNLKIFSDLLSISILHLHYIFFFPSTYFSVISNQIKSTTKRINHKTPCITNKQAGLLINWVNVLTIIILALSYQTEVGLRSSTIGLENALRTRS